jgi:two-component system, cell cycle sensor histidine kinase and response regulator CckA
MPSPHRHWPTRLPTTVLIVYGDDGLLRRIARSLSGLTCVTATTGEAALAWLGEGVPDLMVVDLDLPDMPAQELITRQKNAGELVPFIILTDDDVQRGAVEIRNGGALDCLVKDAHWLERLPLLIGQALHRLEHHKPVTRVGKATRSSVQRLRPQTRLTRAEEALRESEARFHALADLVPDLVWMANPEGRAEWYNQRWIEYTGQSLEEAKGSSWMSAIHPMDLERTQSAWRRSTQTGEPLRIEHRIRDVDGLHRWFLVQARPLRDAGDRIVRWFGTATDIDDLKRAEVELHRREERFRSLIENASDLITVIDAEGLIRFQSPSIERVLGYRPVDLLNRSAFDFVHPEDAPRAQDWLQRALSVRPSKSPIEYRFRHRNGTWLLLQSIGRKMPGEDDRELLLINSRDVTAQERLEAQLRQAQKMEAIGQLAGGVAHDFNNLLSVIFGHCAVLARALALEDSLSESLAEINRAAERGAALTRQLLAFSRQQILAPKVLNLNAVVDDTDNMLRRLIGEDVCLVTVLAPHLTPVRADPGKITQVIMNLAVNARDAMPKGGTLTLETREVELVAADVEAQPARYALLAVTDTGCGMTPEVQAHLFEPFFTTKSEGKGTGLGLAVVHGIVTQSGGYLVVQSAPGVGTTFNVYLPVVHGPVEISVEGVSAQPLQSGALQGGETILLAEDEEAVRQITARLLEAFGYRVLKAASGEEALHLAESSTDKIDLLMADVVMPGMSGRELADALQARDPALKVLFQSGYIDDAVLRHGIVQAEVAFLQKPFTQEALARKVREVFDRP